MVGFLFLCENKIAFCLYKQFLEDDTMQGVFELLDFCCFLSLHYAFKKIHVYFIHLFFLSLCIEFSQSQIYFPLCFHIPLLQDYVSLKLLYYSFCLSCRKTPQVPKSIIHNTDTKISNLLLLLLSFLKFAFSPLGPDKSTN